MCYDVVSDCFHVTVFLGAGREVSGLRCLAHSDLGSVIENVYIINLHTFSAPIATLLCHPSIEGIRSYGKI